MSGLINFFIDNAGLLLQKGAEHIALSALAIGIAVALALPAGIYLGHKHRGSLLAINVSNVLRALPSLALIAIALAFLGLSLAPITIALVALALPPILTNAYTAVDNVEPDAVEAARGMGMSERQVLFGVELPLSWPLIFAGIRTASVYVIATVPLRRHHPQPAHVRARWRHRRHDHDRGARLRGRCAARSGAAAADAIRHAGLQGPAVHRPAHGIGCSGGAGSEREPIEEGEQYT